MILSLQKIRILFFRRNLRRGSKYVTANMRGSRNGFDMVICKASAAQVLWLTQLRGCSAL
ncbi:hypothetical protein [Burkholderia anthina]|uniref:hypothetical protein n=1 Tax=Burkholderia anthina TaxID=179879 RepID=UPI00158F63EA|nr:hypothetical protein [Burkholderia anthina]